MRTFGVFFLVMLATLNSYAEINEVQVKGGKVIFVLGEVVVRQEPGSEWHPVSIGDTLSDNAEIQTFADSMVKIECEGGGVLVLGANSRSNLRTLIEDAKKIEGKRWIRNIWYNVKLLIGECSKEGAVMGGGVRGVLPEEGEKDLYSVEAALRPYWRDEEVEPPTRGDLKEAIKTLEGLLEADPQGKNAAVFQYCIGECHEKLENTEEASLAYEKVVEIYPKTWWAILAKKKLKRFAKDDAAED
jgi:tetratricopeptide (TPR) repeat protein